MSKPTEKLKKRVEDELDRVNREIQKLKREPRDEELEALGDNTPLSEEADAASATEERELRTDRLGRLLNRAAALDEALHRISEGTYGLCVDCQRPISPRRLEAVPEAARCAPCQEKLERGETARAEGRTYEEYEQAETREEEA